MLWKEEQRFEFQIYSIEYFNEIFNWIYLQKDLDKVFGTTHPSKQFILLGKTKMAELVLTHLNTSFVNKQQQEAFYT